MLVYSLRWQLPNAFLPSVRRASTLKKDVDVAIVGSGFAGVHMVQKTRELGLSAQCFEAGADVGGTWYWNRYPGAKCDVESFEYCYSWCPEINQEWTWKHRYGRHDEIQAYIRRVAEKYGILTDIQFNTKVTSATFDESSGRWVVATKGGEQVSAQYLVTAVGGLSEKFMPNVVGDIEFKGRVIHTQEWPQGGVDFSGRRVAVVGVGSSGVQCIPHIAKQAAHLYVFMRTPNYVLPACDTLAVPRYDRLVKKHYSEFMNNSRIETASGTDLVMDSRPAADIPPGELQAGLEARYREGGLQFLGVCADAAINMDSNMILQNFLRGKIRDVVRDPVVAEALCPSSAFMAKRPTVGDGFYETFNRPNVSLVDLKGTSVEALAADGIITCGEKTVVDDIVFATGFDSVTGALNAIAITGRSGLQLKETWAQGPQSYLGLGSAGFPNLFTITGPLSPGLLTNVVASIEQHVDWIGDCMRHMRDAGKERVEATETAQKEWAEHVNSVAELTIFNKSSRTAYRGSNIPGKSNSILCYPAGLKAYRLKCDQVVANGYEGFEFS